MVEEALVRPIIRLQVDDGQGRERTRSEPEIESSVKPYVV